MWEIRSIDLGARAAFVATLRFYIRALVMKKVSAVDVRFGANSGHRTNAPYGPRRTAEVENA